MQPLAAVGDDGARPLVEQLVAAHEAGVVVAEPDGPVGAADLLVHDDDDEQVAVGGAPARAGQAQRGGDLRGRLRLHVDRPAAPEEPVGDVAGPGTVGPLVRVGEDGVDVREQAQHRAVLRAAQAGHEVGPRLRPPDERHLEAGVAQETAQELLDGPLVPGRVDRVEPDEPGEEVGRGLLEVRHRPRILRPAW